MYTKRRVMVILLMVVLSASLFFAPAVIINQPGVAPAQASSPVDQQRADAIDSIVRKLNDRTIGLEKYDPMLGSYIAGDGLPEDAIATPDGGVQVLMFMTPNVDISAIGALAKIKWTIDLNLLQVAMATVATPRAVEMLTQIDGMRYITADKTIDAPDFKPVESEPTMFQITDVVGAPDAWTSGYNGSGTVVGFTDSSIDFSIPDLVNSVGYDDDGRPMSYDPSGISMQFLSYANATNVDAAAWTAAGYPLTYHNATSGKYYLNVTGWDPLMARAPFSAAAHYLRYLISEQFGAYGGGLDTFINNFLWEDWELPDLSGLAWDNVSVGWIFQVRDYSYARLFAPMLVLDGSELVIDWAGAKAFTQLYHDVYWYETVANPYQLPYINYITDMMDWSFANDYNDGWYYGFEGVGKGAAVYYKPNPTDYEGYMGLGSLGWVYDDLDFYTYYFNETYFAGTGMNATVEDLWCGFRSDGLGVALLYPEYDGDFGNNHGTWTGHAAVSEGNYGHTVYRETDPLNDTEYFLPGVAPGASAANVKWYGIFGARFGGAFWLAGFHLNSTSAPYHWEYTGQHKADFLSMSWGYAAGSFLDLYYVSLCFDIISIPGLIDAEYEGLLMLTSSGNSGPDYMTSGPPATAGAVVSVGGSVTSAYYNNIYAGGQGTGQNLAFSSNGPSYIGLAQPDVVAPGYRGANSRPAQDYWFLDYTENPFYVETDWTVDLPAQTYDWWQGTSLACPIAAGVAAIILDALDSNGYTDYDPFLIKEILMSSATDQGLDQFVQGHGLVNAGAAVNYITGLSGNEYYFTNTDSYDNYLDATADAWWLYNDYYGP
ncbi:MAG: S8 family serine peptidase, partial [Candidatus Thorarchaeota archaeon]